MYPDARDPFKGSKISKALSSQIILKYFPLYPEVIMHNLIYISSSWSIRDSIYVDIRKY
jgi:hypothetical protein